MHESDTPVPDRFVVPLDGTDFALRAVSFADAWATEFDAEIELVATPHTLDPDARKIPPVWLADAARELQSSKVLTRFVDENDPVTAIVAATNERPSNCLCMPTHGRGPVLGSAVDHLAEQVLLHLEVPALLLGPKCTRWHTGPVLVCHDGSSAANAVVPVASAWAGATGVAVELVHAVQARDTETAPAAPQELTHAATVLGTAPVICQGKDVAHALRDVIAATEPSLVAITTHGRGGLARGALGGVAHKVIAASPCPVLVVRPTIENVRED